MGKILVIPLFDTYEGSNELIHIRVNSDQVMSYHDHVHDMAIGGGESCREILGTRIYFKDMETRCCALTPDEVDTLMLDAEVAQLDGYTGVVVPRVVAAKALIADAVKEYERLLDDATKDLLKGDN